MDGAGEQLTGLLIEQPVTLPAVVVLVPEQLVDLDLADIGALRLREKAAVGVTTLGVIVSILPDPNIEEKSAALKYMRSMREHAELRNEVQRFLKGSAKGRNVKAYAAYIAAGLRGE